MLHPMTESVRNIFLHMRVKRKNIVASSPTCKIKSCSFVFARGLIQAKRPLPTGGGACFSSACLSFGAYTTELYGRRKENPIARRRVKPMEVPIDAQIESDTNLEIVSDPYTRIVNIWEFVLLVQVEGFAERF